MIVACLSFKVVELLAGRVWARHVHFWHCRLGIVTEGYLQQRLGRSSRAISDLRYHWGSTAGVVEKVEVAEAFEGSKEELLASSANRV